MSKKVPLSLAVPLHVSDTLKARAASAEIPVRPATLAAHLLERALQAPPFAAGRVLPSLGLSKEEEAHAREELVKHGMMSASAARAFVAFYDVMTGRTPK